MPRPRTLPDADELHDLRVVQGLTYEEIAQKYGVTRAAVHLALRKSGLVNPRPRYDEEIPWRVAVEHSNNYHLSMLRLAARRKHGLPIPEIKERYLDNWIAALARPRPGAPDGVVIDYAPGHYPDAFGTPARRKGIDNWLIREPERHQGDKAS